MEGMHHYPRLVWGDVWEQGEAFAAAMNQREERHGVALSCSLGGKG